MVLFIFRHLCTVGVKREAFKEESRAVYTIPGCGRKKRKNASETHVRKTVTWSMIVTPRGNFPAKCGNLSYTFVAYFSHQVPLTFVAHFCYQRALHTVIAHSLCTLSLPTCVAISSYKLPLTLFWDNFFFFVLNPNPSHTSYKSNFAGACNTRVKSACTSFRQLNFSFCPLHRIG